MLNINITLKNRMVFVNRYEQLVTRRVGGAYRVKERSFKMIDELIAVCKSRRMDVKAFVDSSFEFFSPDVCYRMFHLPFPPVNALKSKKNMARYQKSVLLTESYTKTVKQDVDRRYDVELGIIKANSVDRIPLLVSSGLVSEKTVKRAIDEGHVKSGVLHGEK